MSLLNRLLAVALVGSVAGCDATTYNSVNDALTSTQKTASAVEQLNMPAAAVAAGVGTLALVKALSTEVSNSRGYRVAALETLSIDDGNVKLEASYSLATDADGTTTATLSDVKGTVEGYDATASGSISFGPGSTRGSREVGGSLTASLGYGDVTYAIKEFSVSASYPLPSGGGTLGSCTLQQLEGETLQSELAATLTYDGNGKLKVSGDLTKDGVTTSITDFSQLGG
jgi:hypothetical protein